MRSLHSIKYLVSYTVLIQLIMQQTFYQLQRELAFIQINHQFNKYIDFMLNSWYLKTCEQPIFNVLYFKLLVHINAYGPLPYSIYETIFQNSTFKFLYTSLSYLQLFILNITNRSLSFILLPLFFRNNIIWKYILVIYNFFKTTIIASILGGWLLLYLFYFFKLNFIKQLGIWFILFFLYFWLMSGFTFFLKRYRFGKFTTAIQRFWKRTNMCFWLIEGFLFLIFFYYYLNSSQEPLYMYDTTALNNDFLFNLVAYYTSLTLLVFGVLFLYYLLLNLNSSIYAQQIILIIPTSIILFYTFFVESYQFYYVLTLFKDLSWNYNNEDQLWAFENETIRLRLKHQYLLLCLIAKYWHFLFIFISWVFFLMKSFEVTIITYTLLAVNMQNLLILISLNLLFISNWLKWLLRRYLDITYFWFFTNTNMKFYIEYISEFSFFIKILFGYIN